MALQEAIEAQQQLFVGVIAIAEHAHVRHMIFHHSSEEASERRKLTQLLQAVLLSSLDERSYDRRGARSILPMQFRKGVRCDYPLLVQPLEISLDQARSGDRGCAPAT